MKKSEMRILGLSHNQGQINSYILVLSDLESPLKIPIIIKPNEAQFIALNIEGIKSPRPTSFDLIKNICRNLGGAIHEILIHTVIEGIFYTKIILTNSVEEFEIDCSVGDAIALSVAFKCPIMVSEQVLQISGIEMDDDGHITEEQHIENHRERKSSVSVDNLERMLEQAIENEEYEIASQLRDRINEIKGVI